MPAFGLSDNREEYVPTGIHDFVDFIHDFANALCLDEFHIAGNSMGCVNSVNYTLAHPERVKSFVLIAGGVGDLLPRDCQPPKPTIQVEQYDGTRESMRRSMEAIIQRGEAVSDDLVEMRWLAAERNRAGHAAIFPSLMAWGGLAPWEDQDSAARLSTKGRLDRLSVPGIYLYGRQDVLYPVEWGYEQEKVLPDVQFFYPDDCGHQGQTDQPDLFNHVFLEFFRDGTVSRSTADAAGVSRNRTENPKLVDQI
jgi:pimeloyl-ACP methyl ester carboxylesterase